VVLADPRQIRVRIANVLGFGERAEHVQGADHDSTIASRSNLRRLSVGTRPGGPSRVRPGSRRCTVVNATSISIFATAWPGRKWGPGKKLKLGAPRRAGSNRSGSA